MRAFPSTQLLMLTMIGNTIEGEKRKSSTKRVECLKTAASRAYSYSVCGITVHALAVFQSAPITAMGHNSSSCLASSYRYDSYRT